MLLGSATNAHETQTIHLLLRIRIEDRHRIADHRAVIKEHGSVLLGKIGRTMSPPLQRRANDQISQGLPTFLFLATREGSTGPYLLFRSALRQVYPNLPLAKRQLIPDYYGPLIEHVTTWFELSSIDPMSSAEMDTLRVFTTGRKVADVLKSSMVSCRVIVRS
jgi:hypothetical protein